VSRLWPDEVGVYLAPARVCLVRLARGWRPKVLREQEFPVAPAESGWSASLAVLAARLAEADWSGARLRVVIADHWVRYAPVPYVAEVSGARETESHARALLASIYGDTVDDWSLSLSEAPPGSSRVACVIPGTLLSELHATCAQGGARLVSAQPQLIAAYNCWRHTLPTDGAWFVTVEHGALGAARVGVKGFERIHTVRIGDDWLRELRRLQTFGRLALASGANQRVFVDAPHSWRPVGLPPVSDLEWLEEGQPPLTTLHRLEHLRRMAA
jgi:hypothetical protein